MVQHRRVVASRITETNDMARITTPKIIGKGEKRCRGKCGKIKPYSEFHVRSGYGTSEKPATMDGHFLTECKNCMRVRGNHKSVVPPWESLVKAEQLAIDYFFARGIWATTGKMTNAPVVDLTCWGVVWVEVKHAKLRHKGRRDSFDFTTSVTQQERGLLAHVVLLVCEYPDGCFKYHLFYADDPVFSKANGSLKSGFSFVPGKMKPSKQGRGTVNQLTQDIMDAAENRVEIIEQWRQWMIADLCAGERPQYGKPFAR